MPIFGPAGAATPPSGAVAAQSRRRNWAPAPAEPNSIEDLLNRPGGPQVKGYTQRAGWSTEPIDIKALGLADVDARVALTDVTYGRTRIDGAEVTIGVKDQVAKVTLTDLRLYDGSGHGIVTLDASSGEPAFAADVSLSGIAARPLLGFRRRSTGWPATPMWPGRFRAAAPPRRRWCSR